MKRVTHWEARRSGAGIVIVGKDESGNSVRLHTSLIITGTPFPQAETAQGEVYELAN